MRRDIVLQATLHAGFLPQVGDRPAQLRSKLSWKDMLEQGYVIGGSPATVRERLAYAIKNCIPVIFWSCVNSVVCPLTWYVRIPNSLPKKSPHTCDHSTTNGRITGGPSRWPRWRRQAICHGSKTLSVWPHNPNERGVEVLFSCAWKHRRAWHAL